MRKLFLISAFVLAASVSAHAGPSRALILASNDAPAAAVTATEAKPAEVKPAEAPAAEAAKPAASKKHASGKKRESDEQKARRIAAKYGVYW